MSNRKLLAQLLIITLYLFPTLFFLVHKWIDILSFIIALNALILLWQHTKHNHTELNLDSWWVIVALSSTFLAILITSMLRGKLMLPMLDGSLRYLLAIPIFFVVKQQKINFSRIFEYVCPITLLLFAIQASWHPLFRDEVRLIAPTIYDPNLVGVYTITFAFTCLTSFNWRIDSTLLKCLKILGILAGIILSGFTQSRSGWAAGGALLLFWLCMHYRAMTLKNIFIACGIILCLSLILYHVNIVHERIHEAIHEVSLWLSGHNKETSCGIRLTMWLIALRLFSLHPLQGYADHHLSSYFTDPYISKIGTPVALFTMQYVGPHNDLLQNMVLAGVFGLASVLLVTFVPLLLFLRLYWNSQNVQAKKACVQGLCLVIGILIGGLFSILLGLKMSITFYAVTVYALLATALWQQQKIT